MLNEVSDRDVRGLVGAFINFLNSNIMMIPRRSIISVGTLVATQFTFDNTKTLLFYYILFKQSLKASRHLRARGLTGTVREFWTWISQVRGNYPCKSQIIDL